MKRSSRKHEHLDFEFYSSSLPQKVCWVVDVSSSGSHEYSFECGTVSDGDYQRWKSQGFPRTFVFNYIDGGGKCPASQFGVPADVCNRAFVYGGGAWLVVRSTSPSSEYLDIATGVSTCPSNLTLPSTTIVAPTATSKPGMTTSSVVSSTSVIPSAVTTTTSAGDTRVLRAGQFVWFTFNAVPNMTETGVALMLPCRRRARVLWLTSAS